MRYSEAQKRASRKYNEKAYDRIGVWLHKGWKPDIVAHVQKTNESLNGFITRAILETMQRDTDASILINEP